MKSSNFIGKFILVFLLAIVFFVVSCGSSDEEETTDTGTDTVSEEDGSDTGDTANDSDPADSEPEEENDSTPENPDSAPDDADSTDDSDKPAGETDTDTEPTEPTNPTEPEPTGEPDSEFEHNAEGCTMIEVPKITMGGSYADEINGYFGPSLGDSTIDIIRMYLLGEIQEGTYALGTGLNDNYMQCQQCVMVWVDAAAGKAQEYYFQTSGTLQITQVKDVDGIKRTAGVIKNLILKQVEPLNDYLGDFGFTGSDECIAAGIVEWDTTNTPGNSGD